MGSILYGRRAAYSGLTGGVVNVDGTRSFDVGAALSAGSGTVTVDDADVALIQTLDRYAPLLRTGTVETPGPAVVLREAARVKFTSPASTKELVYKGADGTEQTLPLSVGSARVGLLAARGLAASYPSGSFFATDDNGGTDYVSDGTAWLIRGSRAVELARAERTTNFGPTGPGAVAITGLAVTFTPRGRPVQVELVLPDIRKDATASYVWTKIVNDAITVELARDLHTYAASGWNTASCSFSPTDLVVGTPVTYRTTIECGAGTVTLNGNTGAKAVLRAVEI